MSTGPPAAERLRSFFNEKRRECFLKAQRGEEGGSAEVPEPFDDATLKTCLAFVTELEGKFAGDSTMAVAFVDLMKVYLRKERLADIAGVAVRLFGDEDDLLESFASVVRSTAEEVKAASTTTTKKPSKTAPTARKRRKVDENGGDGDGDDDARGAAKRRRDHQKRRTATWRVEGDPLLGSYFLHEGQRTMEAVARVEAWTPSSSTTTTGGGVGVGGNDVDDDDDGGVEKKQNSSSSSKEGRKYRATMLLGSRHGFLVEVDEVEGSSDDLASILRQCEDVAVDTSLRGANAPMFATAFKKIRLDEKLKAVDESDASHSWREQFGKVVWARDKAQEPPWPALILDPRDFDDHALLDRATSLIGKKHVVRFLGLPVASSLGFVILKKILPFVNSNEQDASNVKRASSRKYFIEGCREADSMTTAGGHEKNGQHEKHGHENDGNGHDDGNKDDDDDDATEDEDGDAPRVPGPGDVVRVKYDDDPTTYLCHVQRKVDGTLFVLCDQFPPEDRTGIPFCPTQDEWEWNDDPQTDDKHAETGPPLAPSLASPP